MSDINIKPVFNRVIVKRDGVDSDVLFHDGMEIVIKEGKVFSRKTNFLIPNVDIKQIEIENSTATGVIESMGELIDSQFSVGQRIAWGRYAGTIVPYKDEKIEIINDDDILFIDLGDK